MKAALAALVSTLQVAFRSRLALQAEILALRHQLNVEGLIGSVRRACLDHLIILGAESLRRILRSYFTSYHNSRCHLSLDKDSPETGEIQPPDKGILIEIPKLGGLHHRYERRAA